MSSTDPITKRLHISGLTSSITAADLETRLSSYGKILALDGLGARDALGNRRPFAYATISTTKGQLARCMGALSGVMWKGAKLRVGEAQADFRERFDGIRRRIVREDASKDDENPRPRKRRRTLAVHAPDMSPITPERARAHPAWRVTSLGRLIRPMRMRPAHPLDPSIDQRKENGKKVAKAAGKDGKNRKVRKRVREPPSRARRVRIDPLKWGSQHIVGTFLEGATIEGAGIAGTIEDGGGDGNEDEDDGDEVEVGEDEDEDEDEMDVSRPATRSSLPTLNSYAPAPPAFAPLPERQTRAPAPAAAPVPPAPSTAASSDLLTEKNASLVLLSSLFGSADAKDDWGGAEELSDVDMDAVGPVAVLDAGGEDEFEVVPRVGIMGSGRAEDADDIGDDVNVDVDVEGQGQGPEEQAEQCKRDGAKDGELVLESAPTTTSATTQASKLRDLFAPREDEGMSSAISRFSLLGHLDLDLDLDLELDDTFAPAVPARPPVPTPAAPRALSAERPPFPPATSTAPFFFSSTPAHGREDDEAKRRERWESVKGELTRGWKKRRREGVKGFRRRGGEGA
ncbi:hypothetical protein K488DRAFT_78160 [Vararia minispora EC-137]|uniref:Uncharacterized protein n=1 Tax=Vararia minispora EC-137 TaxID=1314806 RepID=A0ACB8QMJ9_9AGAM|nr:hypothetical protein K488DRAFT_78160 [Vararia minispora EC-137]